MHVIGRWYLALLAVLCSGIVAHTEGGEAIDPTWLAKARTEVKVVYEKYNALSARLEEESEYRYDKVPGSTGTMPFLAHTRRERVVRLGDNVIVESIRILDNAPKKPQIRLQCDNSDYHFTLDKSQEDRPYALVEYAAGKRKYPLLQQQPGLHNEAFSYLGDLLAAIDNDGKHILHKLRFDEAKELLLVEYTHTAGSSPVQNQIYLDPSHHWRVVERRVETANAIGTEQWSYGITVGGLEFPIKLKDLATLKASKSPSNSEISGRLIGLKITDKTPKDFRLSAFDFPEPIDVAPLPKPTPSYLWILAASVISTAVAMLFAWLKRRYTKTDTLSTKAS